MAEEKKTAILKSEVAEGEKRIVILGHGMVVYTWPILLLGILFMMLASLNLKGEWMLWIYLLVGVFVDATILVDLNRNVVLLLGFISLLFGVIWLLIWYAFDVNLVWGPIAFVRGFDLQYSAPVGVLISFVLLPFWIYDYADAYLNRRYAVENGEIFRLKWALKDSNYRLEGVNIQVVTDDWLEVALWGGDITLTRPQSGLDLQIKNVWRHQAVYERIRTQAPKDRSNPA